MKINDLSLYSRYAFRDLTRSYSKILSIIITLLISLFILSAILTIEDSLENELNENSKVLLGGDLEIDYNNKDCLLYTSPSPRDTLLSRMPSSA